MRSSAVSVSAFAFAVFGVSGVFAFRFRRFASRASARLLAQTSFYLGNGRVINKNNIKICPPANFNS